MNAIHFSTKFSWLCNRLASKPLWRSEDMQIKWLCRIQSRKSRVFNIEACVGEEQKESSNCLLIWFRLEYSSFYCCFICLVIDSFIMCSPVSALFALICILKCLYDMYFAHKYHVCDLHRLVSWLVDGLATCNSFLFLSFLPRFHFYWLHPCEAKYFNIAQSC